MSCVNLCFSYRSAKGTEVRFRVRLEVSAVALVHLVKRWLTGILG